MEGKQAASCRRPRKVTSERGRRGAFTDGEKSHARRYESSERISSIIPTAATLYFSCSVIIINVNKALKLMSPSSPCCGSLFGSFVLIYWRKNSNSDSLGCVSLSAKVARGVLSSGGQNHLIIATETHQFTPRRVFIFTAAFGCCVHI